MRVSAFQFGGLLVAALAAPLLTGCGEKALLGPVANAASVNKIRDAIATSSKSEATTAVASTGTGWATLSGRFVFSDPGLAPKMPPYEVTKDQQFCTEGGRAPLQELLQIDGSGGIKNVVIYLRVASRVHDSAKPSNEPVVFDQKECLFLSHVKAVSVGQPIEIKNSDPMGHNTKVHGAKNEFNQTVEAGKGINYVMQKDEATPADVGCSIHPWMKAYLLPRPNRYFAVTPKEGTFKIENLPAGEELEFQVWHESAAGSQGSLVPGTPETKPLKWTSRGRFKITLQPDETKEISITVPPGAFKS